MKAVGVKDLKARLAEYLRLVKGGETILVTALTEVVAEIRPARRALAEPHTLEHVLDSLAAEGEITRARVSRPRGRWRARGLGLPAGTAAAMLDERRDED